MKHCTNACPNTNGQCLGLTRVGLAGDGGTHGQLAAVRAALDDGEGQALVGRANNVLVAGVESDGRDHIGWLLAADLHNNRLWRSPATLKAGGAADLPTPEPLAPLMLR